MDGIRLRRGRAKPIWAGHPCVMSGAVEEVTGTPAAGDVVLVRDHGGRAIGRGFFAPASQIRVRMVTRDPEEEIDDAWIARRVAAAVARRAALSLPGPGTDVFRLIHGDGDALPGVVADRFGDHAVLQLTVAGMERRRDAIARALVEAAGVRGVLLRPVPGFAESEGLEGVSGDLTTDAVPDEIEVRENGVTLLVDAAKGQKTGHFADHRENRAAVRDLSAGRRVLDAFCGTGGFALHAAAGGAKEVLALDSSADALARAGRNAERNGVADLVACVREDVFRGLRRLEDEGERFDLIVLDPPRMASRRKELRGALRGYKELNLRALRLLAGGGLLATASCTGQVSEDAFERVLREAAHDAGRPLAVLRRSGQGPDHPWPIAAPEGRYLKFIVGQVSGTPRGT